MRGGGGGVANGRARAGEKRPALRERGRAARWSRRQHRAACRLPRRDPPCCLEPGALLLPEPLRISPLPPVAQDRGGGGEGVKFYLFIYLFFPRGVTQISIR